MCTPEGRAWKRKEGNGAAAGTQLGEGYKIGRTQVTWILMTLVHLEWPEANYRKEAGDQCSGGGLWELDNKHQCVL